MFENMTLLALLEKGGVTIILLGLFSVLSIAVMLERAWVFHSFRKAMRGFYSTLSSTVAQDGAVVASKLCQTQKSPLAPVFLAGYAKKGKSRLEIEKAMELAGRAELSRLERFLGVLGTIGSTAPFVGLFGTVLGIIRAFSDLAAAKGAGVGPAAVADGIAEALVATAMGLFVAVPAVIAYNYFVRAASRSALELETLSSEFTDSLAGKDGLEDK